MKYTKDFIREMPKSDLHLHLDGSLRIDSLIEMAKKTKTELPSYTKEGLQELVFKEKYNSLGEYLHGFQYTCNALRDLENIERASYELAIDNQKENVFYIEVRFAPQLLMDADDNLTMEEVLVATNKGLKRASDEFNSKKEVLEGKIPKFSYGIIACAMRMFGKSNFSPYYTSLYKVHEFSRSIEVIKLGALELARAATKLRDSHGLPIVAIDLAGQEDGYPATHFKDAYAYAHKNFMHKTVHAGEAYGAESIFQAITELHAERLGHGYYLFDENKIQDESIKDKKAYIKNLSSFVADRRITLEVCLTSNIQTNPSLKDIKDHPFKLMLENRIATTICTDNRLISNTTVTNEWDLALGNFEMSLNVAKDIVAYGFKKSFYPGDYVEKRKYAKNVMKYFDEIAKKHGIV